MSFRVLYEESQKIINDSVTAEVQIALVQDDICIRLQLDEMEHPLFLYKSFDSIQLQDAEEDMVGIEGESGMGMRGIQY